MFLDSTQVLECQAPEEGLDIDKVKLSPDKKLMWISKRRDKGCILVETKSLEILMHSDLIFDTIQNDMLVSALR